MRTRYALLFILLAGCNAMQETLKLKKPVARLTGLTLKDVKLEFATFVFDVEVDNPYPVALPLSNLDYALSSGAETFLTGSANSQITVPARSKEIVSLPVTVNYIEMLKALKGVRPGAKIPYQADLGLSVDTPALGLMKLPLKKQGELVLPTVSGAEIKDIWNIINPK